MRYNPHALIEGMAIAALRDGLRARLQLRPRRDLGHLRALRGSARRGARRRLPRQATSSASDFTFQLYNHHGYGAYICGEETALLESLEGKKGHAALQAAVPGELRPLRQADDDQQHRDVRRGAVDHQQRRRRVPRTSAGRTTAAPRSSRSPGDVARPGNYEVKLGTPFAKLLEMAGGMRGGRKLKAVHPRRLVDAGAAGRDHDGDRHGLRLDRQGGLDARLRRRDRHGRDALHGEVAAAPVVLLLRGVVRPVHAVPRRHRLAVARGRPHRARQGQERGPRPAGVGRPTTSPGARSARWATPPRCR